MTTIDKESARSQQSREEFAQIDEVLKKTALIPMLNQTLSRRGIRPKYFIIDALETTLGIPVLVRSRYIVPKFPYKYDHTAVYPGLIIAEILGITLRKIDIQIGLRDQDNEKLSTRKNHPLRIGDPIDNGVKPLWWNYDYPVVDLTHHYDLAIRTGESLADLAGYIWKRSPTALAYEHQDRSGMITPVWDREKLAVERAFCKIKDSVDRMING